LNKFGGTFRRQKTPTPNPSPEDGGGELFRATAFCDLLSAVCDLSAAFD